MSDDEYSTQTCDRHYTKTSTTFTKRTLRPEEYNKNFKGETIIPRRDYRHLINEHAALNFIANQSTIKVPRILDFSFNADFQCQITLECVPGIPLDQVPRVDQPGAFKKVSEYVQIVVLPQLRSLRSTAIGGLSGHIIVPEAVRNAAPPVKWSPTTSTSTPLVFCHNDLYPHNILVDPRTYEVTAILDWEYSGFYPPQFEQPLWRRSARDHHRFERIEEKRGVRDLVAFLLCVIIYEPTRSSGSNE